MTEAALVEGQVKLRDGKKVRARRAAGGRARAAAHALCPRSGRAGGWCCASRHRWQVSGRAGGARGAGGRGGLLHWAASSPEIAGGSGAEAVTGERGGLASAAGTDPPWPVRG